MYTTFRTVSALALAATCLTACVKDEKEVAEDLGIVPSTCGSDGARLQATVEGSSYCATAQLIAVGDPSSVLVTGVDMLGSTLILQVDTLGVGTHTVSEAENSVLYMQTGTSYTAVGEDAGTITITAIDTVAHHLAATFDVTLHNEVSAAARTITGSVDVTYSPGQ